jgi:hypothetical protein
MHTPKRYLLEIEHRVRRLRDRAIQAGHRARKPADYEAFLTRVRPLVENKVAAFTVAFNVTQCLELLSSGISRFGPGTTLIVCDNSPTAAARQEIGDLCGQRHVPYISLPRPPLERIVAKSTTRSHAMALTWIFYKLVRPLRPEVFAFLDHDMIPLAPFDFRDLLGSQEVYGLKIPIDGERADARTAWALWAGYCIFSFRATAHLPFDFGTDFLRGLDTGGQNWTVLYRHLDPDSLRFARYDRAGIPVEGAAPFAFERIDDWLHINGVARAANRQRRLDMAVLALRQIAKGS